MLNCSMMTKRAWLCIDCGRAGVVDVNEAGRGERIVGRAIQQHRVRARHRRSVAACHATPHSIRIAADANIVSLCADVRRNGEWIPG